jgi:hypothetical protein
MIVVVRFDSFIQSRQPFFCAFKKHAFHPCSNSFITLPCPSLSAYDLPFVISYLMPCMLLLMPTVDQHNKTHSVVATVLAEL